jgi:hypothetical protein
MEKKIHEFECREKLAELEQRLSRLEEQANIKVRVVKTAKGYKLVLEQICQTWYSPKYFEKVLKSLDHSPKNGSP